MAQLLPLPYLAPYKPAFKDGIIRVATLSEPAHGAAGAGAACCSMVLIGWSLIANVAMLS